MNADKNIFLGIGTGRNGSTSLATLINRQLDTFCSHEHYPKLTWSIDANLLSRHIFRLKRLQLSYNHVGDFAHWWLPYLNILISEFPKIKILILKRNCKETIESFMSIHDKNKGGDNANHWIDHDGDFYAKSAWDPCYPKLNTCESLEDALIKYWENYYEEANSFFNKYPKNCLMVQTEQISKETVQKEIFNFLGYKKPMIDKSLHLNRGHILDSDPIFR